MSKKPSLDHQPEPLKMSKASIIEYTSQKRLLYQTHPHRAYRIHLLNQYCETTGFDRKYAQKLLSGKRKGDGTGRGKNAGRPTLYTETIKKIIQTIWKSSEQPCGKRLKQTIPLLLPSYEKRHGQLDETIRELLLKISPAQIDRLLSENKTRAPGKKWWLKRPGVEAIREKIAIRAERWQVEECGWLEVDSVALCGGDISGGFIWILTVTDVWSGWSLWNNLYRVQMKQLESRRHDPTPQSAARRIMEMKETEPSIRKGLEKLYQSNDPLDLHDECERGLKHIYQLLATLRKNEPMSELEADELCQLQGKLTLRYAPFQLALKNEKTTLRPAS